MDDYQKRFSLNNPVWVLWIVEKIKFSIEDCHIKFAGNCAYVSS